MMIAGRCTHVSDWLWSAPLRLAVFGRSRHIRRHPRTSSGEDDPVVVAEGVRSCGALRRLTAELGAVGPHAMHHDGKFSGDSDDCPAAALPTHQAQAPALDP